MQDRKIVFDGWRVYCGLVYHLPQPQQDHWKFGDTITRDSVVTLANRLTHFRPVAVRRPSWRIMTDRQRLDWLLDVAHTDVKPINGTTTLELVRRSSNGITTRTQTESEAEEA